MLEHILQYVNHIDPQDNEGHIPLHMAIFANHPECARLLIIHGAETDVIDETGRSKLHYIAEDNNLVIAKLLCKVNTDLNIPDRDGNTFLHLLLCWATEVVEYFWDLVQILILEIMMEIMLSI